MKGLYPEEELKPLLRTVTSVEVSSVDVPGLDAERHVVIIEP
jgi:16S rRNA G527 N7-methylase RsmG